MSSRTRALFVVAGEASGDRIAASVVRALRSEHPDLVVHGMGGPALEGEGVELLADLRETTGMGTTELVARLRALAKAIARIESRIVRKPPATALLVDSTELNLVLGRQLRRRGTRVLYCVAPQLWAWRPGRLPRLRQALDRLAVVLPFEEPLFRAGGIDACYVGHPALDTKLLPPDTARSKLGLGPGKAVALLPGSRPHEVRATLPTMIDGLRHLPSLAARLFLAPSLDPKTRAFAENEAARAGIGTVSVDAGTGASPWLPGFDAAIVTSGTATLECALAGTAPLTVYRGSRLTALLARRLLRTRHVALPNILLGERRFPELLQEGFTPKAVADELSTLLARSEGHRASAEELRDAMRPEREGSFGERTAALLRPWISRGLR